MKLNHNMRALFEEHAIRLSDAIPEINTYPIWRKTDAAGSAYWGVSSFWSPDRQPPPSDMDLSQAEWDWNEIYLEAQSSTEIADMLRQAIGIVTFWKRELETTYPETPFYIFASYDNGDMLIPDEGELPTQFVNLRFWADRGNGTVINLEHFESWEQPAIIEYCHPASPSA